VNQPDETLFFEDPTVNRSPPGDYGILYLLRRDITRCMDNSILWPAAMAIMAGIDLLAKFETGDDRPRTLAVTQKRPLMISSKPATLRG